VFAAVLTGVDSALFFTIAGATTLVLVARLTTFVGLLDRRWWWLGVPIAVLSGVHAVGLSHMLRM
jgi:hypothetical protein